MKTTFLLIVFLLVAIGDASAQTIEVRAGSVETSKNQAGQAVMPMPYDSCPVGYMCHVLKWLPAGAPEWIPMYYVHADGSKTVMYIVDGKTKLKTTYRTRRAHAQTRQPDPSIDRCQVVEWSGLAYVDHPTWTVGKNFTVLLCERDSRFAIYELSEREWYAFIGKLVRLQGHESGAVAHVRQHPEQEREIRRWNRQPSN